MDRTGLTAREQTVLALTADGLTAEAIAHRLGISPHTVIKHQQHIYRKLGVNDRLTAVLVAQQAGLLAAGFFDTHARPGVRKLI
jgi:DNA-binding CsgD family transcriptional regulator